MTLIASIDGPNRDIYLHADTVGASVHPVDVYKEMRALRRTDETLRAFDLFMSAHGNEAKGGGKFTERYAKLLNGARLVPYNTSHDLTIVGTVITDDGQEGIACFDRGPLAPTTNVNINYVPPQVEVIAVPTGGSGLDAAQDARLTSIDTLTKLLRDLAEADEVHTAAALVKKLRGTATELLRKNVTGSSLTGTLTIGDP